VVAFTCIATRFLKSEVKASSLNKNVFEVSSPISSAYKNEASTAFSLSGGHLKPLIIKKVEWEFYLKSART